MQIKINLKQIGKKKNSIQEVTYEIPFTPHCVRDLIEAVSETCVNTYNDRVESSEILKCMTKEELECQALAGKISFGINYGKQKAELIPAVNEALQSFEDGIYRIFMDDQALTALDQQIHITEESRFTFVRLVMLAGRMW